MRRAIGLLFLSMLIIAMFAPQAAAQKGQLVVGFSAYSAAFMPAFVADRSGYFSQEGLSVKLIFFQSGVQLAQSLISGDTQIGMGSAPELITAVNAGVKMRAVWGISNKMPYALISRPQIRTINELKGKKIAVSSRGSLSEFLAAYVLKSKGLDPQRDVTYLPIGGVPTRFAAVQSGSVDASLISAAHFEKARQSGLNLLLMLEDIIPEWPLDIIYLREDFLTSREAEFKAYLKAYRQGVATSKKNPDAAIAGLRHSLRFDQSLAKEGYHAYVSSLPDDGRIAEKGLELTVDQMFESGTIKKRFSMKELIDYRYIWEAQKK
ncbi:MAG: PhnD/SsuA/transferrin family substrate-binding protein [Deltaproteobacteria bacterium]|nr:PhnD/SsuA/transferrin family substrate-binding protein [Deltaproteobacteria bacterium]